MLPILDGYAHCKKCVVASGDEPYIQNIEVGIKNNTDLYVNCKTHELVITKFKIEPVDTECDCCE
tara:strand:+ start:435 stop:629 length:195 start_codon:yes stop_codon:yes gene_type:complete